MMLRFFATRGAFSCGEFMRYIISGEFGAQLRGVNP
jgi:hypothetical protein